MKCLNIMIAVLFVAVAAFAGPGWVDSVTTNATIIVPARNLLSGVQAWEGGTNTYLQGEVVQNANTYYWAVAGGISTNLGPIHSIGQDDAQRDGVLWRAFDRTERNGLVVSNHGTNDVFLSFGYPATAGRGHVLKANGGAIMLPDSFQKYISAVLSNDETNSVGSVDW